jgi:hypothetical protein
LGYFYGNIFSAKTARMKKAKELYKFISTKYQTLHLEYKVNMVPRYGHGLPAHTGLDKIITENEVEYQHLLNAFKVYFGRLQEIPTESTDASLPHWNNQFLPGLDIIALYGMLAEKRPNVYIEIGSGNSTKVVRKAIQDQELSTKLMSVDPFPRAEIDHLADEVHRVPVENITDLQLIVDRLEENDILFIDNSHRVFPNSDATVCFLEILPNLKKGVIVHIHDIYLPFDYPQFMCDRFYNEQYVLAAFILANPKKYTPILPNYYISEKEHLASIICEFWNHQNTENVERHGGSFWLQIGE